MRATVGIAAVALLLCASCDASSNGSSEQPDSSPTQGTKSASQVATGPVVRLVALDPGAVQAQSQLKGRVRLTTDGCLTLAGDPVAWPSDASWDNKTNSVRSADGVAVPVGSMFFGVGPEVPADSLSADMFKSSAEFKRITKCVTLLDATYALLVRDMSVTDASAPST